MSEVTLQDDSAFVTMENRHHQAILRDKRDSRIEVFYDELVTAKVKA